LFREHPDPEEDPVRSLQLSEPEPDPEDLIEIEEIGEQSKKSIPISPTETLLPTPSTPPTKFDDPDDDDATNPALAI
jgi:hypothetical protein